VDLCGGEGGKKKKAGLPVFNKNWEGEKGILGGGDSVDQSPEGKGGGNPREPSLRMSVIRKYKNTKRGIRKIFKKGKDFGWAQLRPRRITDEGRLELKKKKKGKHQRESRKNNGVERTERAAGDFL